MSDRVRAESDEGLAVAAGAFRWLFYLKAVAFLSLTAVTIVQTVTVVQDFYRRDVVTSLVKELADSVPFPSVTICNYNRWRKSLLLAEPEAVSEVTLAYQNYFKGVVANASIDDAYPKSHVDVYNLTFTAGWHLLDAENIDDFPQYNHKTLLYCLFAGTTCNTKFFRHRMTKLGNCYVFNYDLNSTSVSSDKVPAHLPLSQTHVSERSGLSLLIDIDKDEYIESMYSGGTPLYGLRVLIHPPYETPDPSTQGFSVCPGSHATVAVTKTKYSNLEPPYGSCDLSRKLSNSQRYTLSGCDQECKMTAIEKNCTCRPFYFPKARNMCSPGSTFVCAQILGNKIDSDFSTYCDCPLPCEYEEYSYSLSYTSFPSAQYGSEMAGLMGTTVERYSNTVISLNMYMKEIGQTTISQAPAKTLGTVLSDFGGIVGLFLGVSCVTLVDLLDALAPWVSALAKRQRAGAARDNNRLNAMDTDPSRKTRRIEVVAQPHTARRRVSSASPIAVKQAFF